jgi:biotin carboxyl carrier protein
MKYTLKIEGQEYTVEIKDLRARPITAIVDGIKFEIWPQTANNLPATLPAPKSTPVRATALHTGAELSAPSRATSLAQTDNIVRAPIPGVIIEILVKPGDEVQHGLELCIIEAMKMRNTIRSNRTGQVAEIHVAPGQTVNHGAPLITFTD